ncbi:hypothetical protein PYCCODRAFT_331351 [Trametes coccinea BRFM310]|uniref:Uncharacterized protein n=1 Tax=Trametes coccinea (strain BRFM310) TaxID=1353009 RepID=A0A1Y2INH4_TRAC3|nr:hypothetical protein PYCCODRAFT_331351 [Trametes coccinea BRFM310]
MSLQDVIYRDYSVKFWLAGPPFTPYVRPVTKCLGCHSPTYGPCHHPLRLLRVCSCRARTRSRLFKVSYTATSSAFDRYSASDNHLLTLLGLLDARNPTHLVCFRTSQLQRLASSVGCSDVEPRIRNHLELHVGLPLPHRNPALPRPRVHFHCLAHPLALA